MMQSYNIQSVNKVFIENYNKSLDFLSTQIDSIPKNWAKYYKDDGPCRIPMDAQLVAKYCNKDDKILDLGANPPFLAITLMLSGFNQVYVNDISDSDWKGLDGIFKFLPFDLESPTFPVDSQFDAIILNQVFEHLRIDLIQTFENLRKLLKPNGLLFLSTPNMRSVRGIKDLICSGLTSGAGDIHLTFAHIRLRGCCGHIREYTPHEVSLFLTKMGFEIKDIQFTPSLNYSNFIRKRSGDYGLLNPIKILKRYGFFCAYSLLNRFFPNLGELMRFVCRMKKDIPETTYDFGKYPLVIP